MQRREKRALILMPCGTLDPFLPVASFSHFSKQFCLCAHVLLYFFFSRFTKDVSSIFLVAAKGYAIQLQM